MSNLIVTYRARYVLVKQRQNRSAQLIPLNHLEQLLTRKNYTIKLGDYSIKIIISVCGSDMLILQLISCL